MCVNTCKIDENWWTSILIACIEICKITQRNIHFLSFKSNNEPCTVYTFCNWLTMSKYSYRPWKHPLRRDDHRIKEDFYVKECTLHKEIKYRKCTQVRFMIRTNEKAISALTNEVRHVLECQISFKLPEIILLQTLGDDFSCMKRWEIVSKMNYA